MGLRFRKTFKAGPFRATISKTGISTSVGVKGARITKRADGKTQTTAYIPGTGVSYVKTSGSTQQKQPAPQKQPAARSFWSNPLGQLAAMAIGLGIVIFMLSMLAGCGAKTENKKPPLSSVTTSMSSSQPEQESKPAQQSPEASKPEQSPEASPAPNPVPEPEQAPEPKPEPKPQPKPALPGVIGNKNSKKFHELGCSSIGDMKESNKVSIESYDAAIAMGYQPCKRCH